MGEPDSVARPPADRASLEAELRRIDERQSELDRRRATYAAMHSPARAWLRRLLDDLDFLAAARDRVAAGWDQLATIRDEAARNRDAQASERDRAPSGLDAGLDQATRGAHAATVSDRVASKRDRSAAREDRERSALDRARSGVDRDRAKQMRDEQATLVHRVEDAASAVLGELIAAEEELELTHQLADALLEQLALTETDNHRIEQLIRQAEQERGRAEMAGKRAEHARTQIRQVRRR